MMVRPLKPPSPAVSDDLRSRLDSVEAELLRVSAELEQQSQRLKSTFESPSVGMAHVDLDGKWLAVNDTLCGIVGYSREELLRLTFQDITHPDDLAEDLALVQKLLTGELGKGGQVARRHRVMVGHRTSLTARTGSGQRSS